MVLIESALLKAKNKAEVARRKNRKNMSKRPATGRALLRTFNIAFKDAGYGVPPVCSKKTLAMLNTFVRMSLKEGGESSYLYELMKDIVGNWELISREKITTKQGKYFAVSRAPSLNDFLLCKESILAIIQQNECRVDCVVDSPTIRSVETSKPMQHGPTEEEMQKEMERLQDELFN